MWRETEACTRVKLSVVDRGRRVAGGLRRPPTGTLDPVTRELRTFLTFQGGRATEALDLYRSVFDDFELVSVSHYGPDGPGAEGTIIAARFRLAGSEFGCADSPIDHPWGFTPAVSLWIECTDDTEQQRLFDRLSEDGQVYMPLGDYGFSPRFGWVGDPFGVTWQLNLG
ncbi:MAG: VOC family protein [Acidimicrobiales bacterium]|nr:VOC family protein [Acidimicrobiales bacterium]